MPSRLPFEKRAATSASQSTQGQSEREGEHTIAVLCRELAGEEYDEVVVLEAVACVERWAAKWRIQDAHIWSLDAERERQLAEAEAEAEAKEADESDESDAKSEREEGIESMEGIEHEADSIESAGEDLVCARRRSWTHPPPKTSQTIPTSNSTATPRPPTPRRVRRDQVCWKSAPRQPEWHPYTSPKMVQATTPRRSPPTHWKTSMRLRRVETNDDEHLLKLSPARTKTPYSPTVPHRRLRPQRQLPQDHRPLCPQEEIVVIILFISTFPWSATKFLRIPSNTNSMICYTLGRLPAATTLLAKVPKCSSFRPRWDVPARDSETRPLEGWQQKS
ncbi:hypothetical protein B0H13DRAFT_1883447 [Mycena leptocephala]|nr:hypothetical protein B0H13DRAFT_1883447 [Mycena leptocephala]